MPAAPQLLGFMLDLAMLRRINHLGGADVVETVLDLGTPAVELAENVNLHTAPPKLFRSLARPRSACFWTVP